jgi:hypothetical protein
MRKKDATTMERWLSQDGKSEAAQGWARLRGIIGLVISIAGMAAWCGLLAWSEL